jgi:hypothetical protein
MAKGKMKGNLQLLVDQRARLVSEMEALKNKVAGLDMAISLLSKDGVPGQAADAQKASLKATIIDLLRGAGPVGLNASTAVEMAKKMGISLNRGSVASNLSRMSKEKTIVYDGDKYRLPEFAPKGPVIVKATFTA